LENAIDFGIKEISESTILLGSLKDYILKEKEKRAVLIKSENIPRVKEILDAYEIPYKIGLDDKSGVYVEEGFYDRGIEKATNLL